MKAMFKFTALLALSLAALGVVAAGKTGDGKGDAACDAALLQHVRDPLARILDHLTPSERLLAELSNETIGEPVAFISINPVQVNMMLMTESFVPTPTISSATETASGGSDTPSCTVTSDPHVTGECELPHCKDIVVCQEIQGHCIRQGDGQLDHDRKCTGCVCRDAST